MFNRSRTSAVEGRSLRTLRSANLPSPPRTRRSADPPNPVPRPPVPVLHPPPLIVSRFCRDYQTVDLQNVKAICWNHFGTLSSATFAIPAAFIGKRCCRICLSNQEFLSTVCKLSPGTSVTNAKTHLRVAHDIVYEEDNVVLTVGEFQYALTVKCCLDYSSFASINNSGFLLFMKTIRPDLKVPTGNHLAQNVLPKIYREYKKHIKAVINEQLDFGHISFDLWIDNFYERDYICFNLFFLDTNFELNQVLLDVQHIPPPHNRFNILSKLREVLADYNIAESKLTFSIDAGQNVRAALRLGNLTHFLCSSHGLHNLVTKDCIKGPDSSEGEPLSIKL